MRQTIRDKYKIEKKQEVAWEPAPGAIGRSRGPGESALLPGQEKSETFFLERVCGWSGEYEKCHKKYEFNNNANCRYIRTS